MVPLATGGGGMEWERRVAVDMIWAPDLGKYNGVYYLHFSAQRVPNGMACPASGQDVTTFVASAPDLNLAFGSPQPINPSTT